MWPALREAYADGVFEVFRRYWRAYGGIRALALSPYFHVAALLTALLAPYWLHQPWWDVALSAMPSLLGFTLAGFTIWLGLGSPRLRELMSRPGADGAPSVYVQVAATFVHFVVTQILALVLALVAKALDFVPAVPASVQGLIDTLVPWGHGLGFLVFVYAIMTALAAAMGVFRVATWQDIVHCSDGGDRSDRPPQA